MFEIHRDFVKEIEKYLGGKFLNYVIHNSKKPSPKRVEKYEKEGAVFVKCNYKNSNNHRFKVMKGSFLRKKGFIRHDPHKLAKALINIIK